MLGTGATHSSRDFETELRELRAHLVAMGARCEQSVRWAFDAFRRGVPELRAGVEQLDAQIDRDEIEIHVLILRILALRQPVAVDLRFLATALRLIMNLERIGDEAVNISERIVKEGDCHPIVGGELASMAGAAFDMLHDALGAFVRGDITVAPHVLARDHLVDAHCASIISAMTAYIAEVPGHVSIGLRVMRVAKTIERIADHATNIAEEVIFAVRADYVRRAHWPTAAQIRD